MPRQEEKDAIYAKDFAYCPFTDPGGRETNEDSFDAIVSQNGRHACIVLADGLGGHRGGQVASRLAVEAILSKMKDLTEWEVEQYLNQSIQTANKAVLREASSNGFLEGMGTTCVILTILKRRAYWAHVGDSRLYLFRDGRLITRTRDHSVVQLLVDMGDIGVDEAANHIDRNKLIKSLGGQPDIKPEIMCRGMTLQPGDVILLCSDGFWGQVNDKWLQKVLFPTQKKEVYCQYLAKLFALVKNKALERDRKLRQHHRNLH